MKLNKIILFILVIILNSINSQAQVTENEYKAAFIERFTRFIEWPANEHLKNEDAPFTITILGENTLGQALDEFFDAITIKNKKVKLIYTTSLSKIEESDLIFVSGSYKRNIPQLLSHIENLPILTISDTPGFATDGIQINLVRKESHIRYEINLKALKAAGLKVNSLLLASAKIIN